MSDPVHINILGHNVRFKRSGDEEKIKKVVGCIEEKVEEARKCTGTADSMRLLIYAAMYLADENMRIKDEFIKLKEDVDLVSSRMLSVLELKQD